MDLRTGDLQETSGDLLEVTGDFTGGDRGLMGTAGELLGKRQGTLRNATGGFTGD